MGEELGVVVTLYVLTRLLPAQWLRLSVALRILTAAVSILVCADLAVGTPMSNTIRSRLRRSSQESPTPASDSVKTAPGSVKPKQTVTRADGGSVVTPLGFGIAVAKDSSLHREWIAVHTDGFAADLEGTPGITTRYARKEYSGEYRYRVNCSVATSQPLRAIQLVFLTFDVWGNHARTLSYEEVADIPIGHKAISGEWNLYSENDVEKHYASIAYVARVRLADGHVMETPTVAVLEEARKFSNKFTAADLEVKPPTAGTGRGGS